MTLCEKHKVCYGGWCVVCEKEALEARLISIEKRLEALEEK